MKKVAFAFLLYVLPVLYVSCQAYNIAEDINIHYNIKGVGLTAYFRTVQNNYPIGTDAVKFLITDVSHSTAYGMGWGTYDSQYDDYTFSYDLGTLPSNAPSNLVVYASYYANGVVINGGTISADWPLTIIPNPAWMTQYGGTITGVVLNAGNSTYSCQANVPLSNILSFNQSVSQNTEGIGGKAFSISSPELAFVFSFNVTNGTTVVTQSNKTIFSNLTALGTSLVYADGSNFTGNLTLDNNLNILFNGTAVYTLPSIKKTYQFEDVPLQGINTGIGISAGALCLNTRLDFLLEPKVKAQICAGIDANTQQWGFIQSGSDITQLLAKVKATTIAKGELTAVCLSGFGFNMGWGTIARGSITASVNVGGGIQYKSLPVANTISSWYGDLDIQAEGEVTGFGSKSGSYTKSWGSPTNFNFKTDEAENDFFESSTEGVRSSITPLAWPMAKVSARDSLVAAVWIDNVNFGDSSALFMSYYSPTTGAFSTPTLIAINDSGICNHTVALLPDKKVFITYSQLNKPQSATANLSVDDITRSQDVYLAIIAPWNNSVVYKGKLPDVSGSRADGEPSVYWGNSNQGMITWQASNPNGGSQIYASEIREVSQGAYNVYNPSVISSNVTGVNYGVSVSYGLNNEAIATWINDPDADPKTHNSVVYYSSWNGTSWWVNPLPRFDNSSLGINISNWIIKDYAIATQGVYGSEALTYEYMSNERRVNGILLRGWNDGDLISLTNSFFTNEDTAQDFRQPKVSVNKSGIASLVIQETSIPFKNSEGQLGLYFKTLNTPNSPWQNVTKTNPQYAQFLTDTNQFVWDLSSTSGYLSNSDDVVYLFTQEADSNGNTSSNSHGEVFGNPNLNLLLRAFKVSNNNGVITLTDLPEPSVAEVTGFYAELSPFNSSFSVQPNYPNPFRDETYIPFHIFKQGALRIDVYDMNGNMIGEVLKTENIAPGDYVTKFERKNLASGIYYYRVSSGFNSYTGKMVVLD